MSRFLRLFAIRTRLEVFLITYGLALGATMRGEQFLIAYPGWAGRILYWLCLAAVFLAGGKMLEAVELSERLGD